MARPVPSDAECSRRLKPFHFYTSSSFGAGLSVNLTPPKRCALGFPLACSQARGRTLPRVVLVAAGFSTPVLTGDARLLTQPVSLPTWAMRVRSHCRTRAI